LRANNLTEDNIKKHRVCGGKVKTDIDLDDPLCTMRDYGGTPLEVTTNMIRIMEDSIIIDRYRYDSKQKTSSDMLNSIIFAQIIFYKFSQKWLQLYNDLFLSLNFNNLSDFLFLNDEDVERFKNLTKKEAKENAEFNAYYQAREVLVTFFKKMVTLPAQHCIYEKEGKYEAISLEMIKKRIKKFSNETDQTPDEKRTIVLNCQSDKIKEWAKQNNKGELFTEVGYNFTPQIYFLSDRPEVDQLDAVAIGRVIQTILTGLEIPGANPNPSVKNILAPLLIHKHLYPDTLRDISDQMVSNLINGTNFYPYLSKVKQEELNQKNCDITTNDMGKMIYSPKKDNNKYCKSLYLLTYESETTLSPMWVLKSNFLSTTIAPLMYLNSQTNENITMLKHYIAFKSVVKTAVTDTILIPLIQAPSAFKDTHPFMYYSIYEKWKSEAISNGIDINQLTENQKTNSLYEILINHPLVCHINSNNALAIPFLNNNNSVTIKLCKTYKKYKACVEKSDCHEREHKDIFITMFQTAYGT